MTTARLTLLFRTRTKRYRK
jgi:hypothetical protein